MTLQDTATTTLGKSATPLAQANPGKSGVFALADGHAAFAARALLADVAEHTLDVQYYIWHNDMSGTLLLDALRRGADRGVRVRVLLDDNNTSGLDDLLAALDSHANIEVRLFNPFAFRRWRPLGYLFDFARLNRRMHNKSFTADNQVTIIGGRNVGDEYFGAGHEVLFVDLDVLAIGPVVNDVSRDFDRYWACASSCPAGRVLPHAGAAAVAEVKAAAVRVEHDPASRAYREALAQSPFMRDLLARRMDFEWADVKMVSDDPAKGLGLASKDEMLWARLRRVMKKPTRELALISPYFVPGASGVEYFAAMAKDGVKISVLTNSLEATDVAAVHAGYAKRRKPLLEAGVALFEMKRESAPPGVKSRRGLFHRSGAFGSASSASSASSSSRSDSGGSGGLGSSGSSLHAKTFSTDRAHVFVGSFNFDPRSERLNTELGFVIDSPALAQLIADSMARSMSLQAYRVRLAEDGALQWVEQIGGNELVHDVEPGTTVWKRLGVSLLSMLPIEWLL